MILLDKFVIIVFFLSLFQSVYSFFGNSFNNYFSNFGFNNFGYSRSSYKLSYFNTTGRAEFIRWIFACNFNLNLFFIDKMSKTL